jgi:hypothetical protein
MGYARRDLRVVLPAVLFLVAGMTHAQTYKYFQIFDVAHQCYVGAGKSYDGSVYEYPANDLGDYTQWRFEPADSGYYYLVDRRHGAALSSDYVYSVIVTKAPGHVRDYQDKKYCAWKAESATTIGA